MKTKLYGIKLLLTKDKNMERWRNYFMLPTAKMPRNGYIRPKIHCGGITSSEKNGKIIFHFYKYKERNSIEYFNKTYLWNELFDTV